MYINREGDDKTRRQIEIRTTSRRETDSVGGGEPVPFKIRNPIKVWNSWCLRPRDINPHRAAGKRGRVRTEGGKDGRVEKRLNVMT